MKAIVTLAEIEKMLRLKYNLGLDDTVEIAEFGNLPQAVIVDFHPNGHWVSPNSPYFAIAQSKITSEGKHLIQDIKNVRQYISDLKLGFVPGLAEAKQFVEAFYKAKGIVA